LQASQAARPQGYLVAKTDAAGGIRHFAVYISPVGRLTIYLTTGLNHDQQRARFDVPSLTDGNDHTILVRVIKGLVLSVVIDGRTMSDVVWHPSIVPW